MSMAGKTYAASNQDRLKAIPLGSGNVYFLPYVEGSPMPSDADFERPANMVGRTKNGATFNHNMTYYTAKSDDGVAQKRIMTEETASFTWGVMTWTLATVAQFIRTASASVVEEDGVSSYVLEGGGLGNQQAKKYWFHFVGGDTIDGKFTLTGVGENIDALAAAFAVNSETVLTPNVEFDPYDAAGHLYKMRGAYQPTAAGETPPQLTNLTLGSLTLDPEFDGTTTVYETETTNATNTITATAAEGDDVVITVNGNSLTNGGAATWQTGANIVLIAVSGASGSTIYTITVNKS